MRVGLMLLALAGIAGGVAAEPGRTDYQIRFWQARLQQDADDPISPIELGWAYAQKARESGDAGYYLRAERALRKSLERGPGNYRALATLAWVEVGEHRFGAARELAQRCVKIHPQDPFNYGTLGDAEVELGQYDASWAAIQRMLALERGLAAYARLAYQRELRGDRQAALRLMRQAAAAADPTDAHSCAWCRAQLGDLYLKGGALREARRQYDAALGFLPGYYLALFGKARVAAAQRQWNAAERLFNQAIAVIPRPDFIAALGDLYALMGRKAAARRQYDLVVQIEAVNRVAGVPDNRRLALFYANHDRDLPAALALARREYALRQDVFTGDALAWALYKNGRFSQAWQRAQDAMRLKTPDAGIFYHAGMIARQLPGHAADARRLLQRSLALVPYFDLLQPPRARAALLARRD